MTAAALQRHLSNPISPISSLQRQPLNVTVVIQLLTYNKIGLQTYILCHGMPLLQYTSSLYDIDTLCVSDAGCGHSLSGWNDHLPLLQLNTYSTLR
jgi:hypothetical protein